MTVVSMSKLHGLGNDFLVALEEIEVEAALASSDVRPDRATDGDRLGRLAAAMCDRHRGIGADGLIVARRPTSTGTVAMELRNADGKRAETSGNGLRCFAHALLGADAVAGSSIAVETDAGLRRCTLRAPAGASFGAATISVEMGEIAVVECSDEVVPEESWHGFGGSRPSEQWRAWRVDAGNPHLVLFAESICGIDMAAVGRDLGAAVAGGQNVEVVALCENPGEIALAVFERGVGVTLACGTGSVAAAAALRSAGLVPDDVVVSNPGGEVSVELSGPAAKPESVLTGPSVMIGTVSVQTDALVGMS